ncbi:MAG: phosphate ABC transporter substrate-binding protein [Eubacteriales bacterium]
MKTTSLLSALVLSTALVSCSSGDTSTTPETSTPETTTPSTSTGTTSTVTPSADPISGTLTMGGSTSVAEVIGGMMEIYMAENDGVDITYAPTGSSTGVQGAIDGTLDLGLSSRVLKDAEKETVDEVVFALDGIAVVVNTENSITDISMSDLVAIFNGEITDWSEVGGTAGEIVTIGRDSASGTRDGFESILGISDVVYTEEYSATGAVIGGVSATPGAIGYISLSAADDKVTTLSIDGVVPSADTVVDGSYSLQRPFVFAVNAANLSPVAESFLNWATSGEADELILHAGVIPPVA